MTTTGFPNLATAAYLRQLRDEGDRLAAAAAPVDLDQPVPACPDWTIRDLLRHVGYVHRWATRYVSERQTQLMPRLDEAAILRQDIPDDALLDWFRSGHAALVQALDAAGPGLACWTFLPGAVSPLAFWARRQAHETTVHRVDVQLAAAAAAPGRGVDPVPADLAADGIDELLIGFARRNARRGPRSDPPRGLFVAAADGYQWVARMSPEQAEVERGWPGPAAGPADCTVTGPAAEVYLLLWNRRDPGDLPGLRLTGDPGVLDQWRRGVRVTWR
jgi:uncharacterized protein (TIGR03083 family)